MRNTLVCVVLLAFGCAREFHEFEVTRPSKVAEAPPKPVDAVGHTHRPYEGKPQYLASARPMQPTTSHDQAPAPQSECAQRTQKCEDRLRGVLASIDGQLVALSTPPTELQLRTLKLQLDELQPLLAPYSDITSERDELADLTDKIASQTEIDQALTKKRMTELSDLIRVQLAAAQ